MLHNKKWLSVFMVPVMALSFVVWSVASANAPANSLYLSSSASSVQAGGTFVVSLRVNPGMSIDTVTANVGYNAAVVSLVGVTCAGAPLSAFPSCPGSGNPVSFTAADLGGSVSTDTLVAQLTFKTLVSSGTASFTLSGNDATAGSAHNPSASGTSVSISPPPCPAGYSGIYPNCVAPPPTPTNSTPSTPHPSTTPPSSSKSGSPTPTKTPTATASPTRTPTLSPIPAPPVTSATGVPGVVVTADNVQYSQATLNLTSSAPTQVWIEYGTDQQHYTNTAPDALATTHQITLNPEMLVPGQTYYYVIISKDQAGQTNQSNVQTFKTKGLTVRVRVVDSVGRPLQNQMVTLHSAPVTAKTDDKGYATFTNVTPGTHSLASATGKKIYTQQIEVVNNVSTSPTNTQTSAIQNVAVMLPFKQSPSLGARLLPIFLILLLAGAAVALYMFRLAIAQAVTRLMARSTATPSGKQSAVPNNATAATLDDRLNAFSQPSQPNPGTTFVPVPPSSTDSSESDKRA